MAGRRFRVEFDDGEGGKYTLSLDGNMSREKVLRIIDIVDLLGGKEEEPELLFSKDTTFGKIYSLVEQKFPIGSFSSTDLLEAYEDEFGRPIKLSTISTYLSRLQNKGILNRQRTPTGWLYRKVRINLLQR